MNKIPADLSDGGNNCQAYIKQFASWYLTFRDTEVREITSDNLAMILKSRPNEHCYKFALHKQAFASFRGQFLKSDPFDERDCYIDTTAHTREEFIAMCVDEDIKQELLERDNKNIKWYGGTEHFKPLVFLFYGGKYWDWAYDGTFEIITSPRSHRLTVVK